MKSRNIRFSEEEIDAIISVLKEKMLPGEVEKADKMLRLMKEEMKRL